MTDAVAWLFRAGGLVVVLAFIALAAMAVADFVDTYSQPACQECGMRHGPAHKLMHRDDA